MANILGIYKKDNYLYIQFGGTYGQMNNLEDPTKLIFDAVEKHDCLNLLIDFRNVQRQKNITTTEEHKLGKFMSSVFDYRFRVALLVGELPTPSTPVKGEHTETTAINRGVRMKLFLEEEKAIAWLKGS